MYDLLAYSGGSKRIRTHDLSYKAIQLLLFVYVKDPFVYNPHFKYTFISFVIVLVLCCGTFWKRKPKDLKGAEYM